jgi:hypothetical protein
MRIDGKFLRAFALLPMLVTAARADFNFTKLVDSTQGYTSFGSMPAIANGGAVAFTATASDFPAGGVFKMQDGLRITIAPLASADLNNFGDAVAINPTGVVGFSAKAAISADAMILTGDGFAVKTIASAAAQGLIGGGFLGLGGINASGTAVFFAFRTGMRSQAVFTGNGGPLTAVVDTATNPNFSGLANAAINAAGQVVFRGFLRDGTEGLFTTSGGAVTDVVDTSNGLFGGFLDPVINDAGTVGNAAFLTSGMELFTANGRGVTARTNPSSTLFVLMDNVSINNSGDLAFQADESTGKQGIFYAVRGTSDAVRVIETGDPLFNSTVTQLNVGRFSVNDQGQIAFRYRLADGRFGIAIAR